VGGGFGKPIALLRKALVEARQITDFFPFESDFRLAGRKSLSKEEKYYAAAG
jgi:hypothetical protein